MQCYLNRLALALVILGPAPLAAQKPPPNDSCPKMPELGSHADGSPVLPTLVGRVLDFDGHSPLTGARIQIVGTQFGTFTDEMGEYRLTFDPRALEKCRPQYINVSSPGHLVSLFRLASTPVDERIKDIILRKPRANE